MSGFEGFGKDSLLEEIAEPQWAPRNHASLVPQLRRHFPGYVLTAHRFDERPHDVDWNDANHYLYLWVNDQPSAFAGWTYTDTLLAGQRVLWLTSLQGVFHPAEPKPVPPKGWALQLTKAVLDVAAARGVDATCITPADENTWFSLGKGDQLVAKQRRMTRVYEGVATELGFARVPATGVVSRECEYEILRQPQFVKTVYMKRVRS